MTSSVLWTGKSVHAAVHTWAIRWRMDFNVNKSKVLTFNNNDKVHPPRYKLNEKDQNKLQTVDI